MDSIYAYMTDSEIEGANHLKELDLMTTARTFHFKAFLHIKLLPSVF